MLAEVSTTGLATLVAASATFVTAVGGVVVGWRASGKADKAHKVSVETNIAVNGRNQALLERTQQLEQELVKRNVPVPPDPHVDPNA